MKKKYEIVLLIDPTIEESEVDNVFNSLLDVMKAQGAEIHEDETLDWGKRKLAFPVKKKDNAIYRVYRFSADSESIQAMEGRLRLNDQLLRQMIVLYDPGWERSAAKAESSK